MITFTQQGDFSKTFKFLERVLELFKKGIFDKYGAMGVQALEAATPKDSGITAGSWSYEIDRSGGGIAINWTNNNENKGVNIAVIVQYGHGTGTGGYVQGRDYINPAMRSTFDRIAEELWGEVTR